MICELAVALISCCLPSIFILAKNGVRWYRSNRKIFGLSDASKPLGGPAGSHIGPIGNPIDARPSKWFVQLKKGDRDLAEISEEMLFDGTLGMKSHTVAYTGHDDHERGAENPDMGIPLHQIHVCEEVQVSSNTV